MNSSERRPAPRRRKQSRGSNVVQPSRLAAFDVLLAVAADEAYANILLPHTIARAELRSEDARLATELCYGTLRRQGFYDRVIESASHRATSQIDPPALAALRLGAHQLLGMRVAPHAAVSESVALARRFASQSAAGFVNGVLRRISADDSAVWIARLSDGVTDETELLAIEHAHPAWIVRAFRRALEAEGRGDELTALLQADNDAPRVNMVALPGMATIPDAATKNRYSPVGFQLGGGDPDAAIGDAKGALRVQDEGSQLAALALSRAREVTPGEQWLDMCAGPGGKSALLAAEARRSGAVLTSNEVAPARADLVRRALHPFGTEAIVWTGDGRRIGVEHPGSFDRILVDAPCTGLGALRRRPEARWRKSPKDVADLSALQAELLDSAIQAAAPGALIAYVTCSPHLGETRAIVSKALRVHSDVLESVDTPAVLRDIAGPIDLGDEQDADAGAFRHVQLWPHRHGTDAMYIMLLRVADGTRR